MRQVDVAKCLVFDKNENILVLTRSDSHPYFRGQLDFPGGAVDEGEKLKQAVKREVQEETGMNLADIAFEHVLKENNPDFHGTSFTYHVFKTDINKLAPEIDLSFEHQSYKWLSRNDLLAQSIPENIDPYYLTVIKFLRSTQSDVK